MKTVWTPDGRIVVHVDGNATDGFLLAAISAGWSVVRVLSVEDPQIDENP